MPRSAAIPLAAGALLLAASATGGCTGQSSASRATAPASTTASPKTPTPGADAAFESGTLLQDSNTLWRQGQVALASQPAENREGTPEPGTYVLSAACVGKGELRLTLSDGRQSESRVVPCDMPTQIVEVTLRAAAPEYVDALAAPSAGTTATMVWRLDRSGTPATAGRSPMT